jgi:hypothetical protein
MIQVSDAPKYPAPVNQPAQAAPGTPAGRAIRQSAQTSPGKARYHARSGACASATDAPASASSPAVRQPGKAPVRRRRKLGRARQTHPQPLDPARIGVDHLEFGTAFVRHDLAARWHPTSAQEHQTAQRVDFLILVARTQAQADGGFELFQRRGRLRDEDAGLFFLPQRAFLFVVLVLDLADHGFDQILDGHQTIDATILVDHQRHVHPFALHLLQQHPHRHRRRRVKHRTQQLAQAEPARRAKAMRQRKILQQHQPLRMVQRALVDRQAGIAVGAKHLDQLVLADIQGHRRDLDLGDCNIVDPQPPQVAQTGHPRRGRRHGVGPVYAGRRGPVSGFEDRDYPPQQPALRCGVFGIGGHVRRARRGG